jgi:GNAT superfamily N-acetyltransferase
MEHTIRRLHADDYDLILDLWVECGLPFDTVTGGERCRMYSELSASHCAWFGLETEEKLVGVVTVRYDGRRGWLERLGVIPDYRAHGLAAVLIEAAERWLAQFGEMVICALIDEKNAPAMTAFEKADYTCMPSIAFWSTGDAPDA